MDTGKFSDREKHLTDADAPPTYKTQNTDIIVPANQLEDVDF